MTIGNHIPEDDLVLFALQLLPEDRTRQAKLHAETCDLCRTEVAKLQGDLASYSMISDIVAPPPKPASASCARLPKSRSLSFLPNQSPSPLSIAPIV